VIPPCSWASGRMSKRDVVDLDGNGSDRPAHPSDQHAWELRVHILGRPWLFPTGREERFLQTVECEPMFEEGLEDHPHRAVEVPLRDWLIRNCDAFARRCPAVVSHFDRVRLGDASPRIELDGRSCVA
jgi:hypothetical protein